MKSVNQTCPRVHDVASVNFSTSSQVRGARRQLATFLRPTAHNTNYLLIFIQLLQHIGLLKGTAQSFSIHTVLPLAYWGNLAHFNSNSNRKHPISTTSAAITTVRTHTKLSDYACSVIHWYGKWELLLSRLWVSNVQTVPNTCWYLPRSINWPCKYNVNCFQSPVWRRSSDSTSNNPFSLRFASPSSRISSQWLSSCYINVAWHNNVAWHDNHQIITQYITLAVFFLVGRTDLVTRQLKSYRGYFIQQRKTCIRRPTMHITHTEFCEFQHIQVQMQFIYK